MNDDFLIRFRKPPRAEFAAALYQRISKPMLVQSKYPILRFAALTVSVLAVLMVTVLAFPSAQTFAQSVLERIGGFVFNQGTPEPLDASRVPAPITIVSTTDSVSIEITSDVGFAFDLAEASEQAGFAVREPTYLPAGYVEMGGGWSITREGNGVAVTSGYFDNTKNYFFVAQWKVGEGELKTFTREQIVEVTVRGHKGVWLPDTDSPSATKALVWEEDGITYSLISNSLPLDELLRVAESLGD